MKFPSLVRSPARSVWRYTWLVVLGWSGVILGLGLWHAARQRTAYMEIARAHARTAYEKDLLYRRWMSSYGGVYVPAVNVEKESPAALIPESQVKTDAGLMLTHMAPEAVTREVHSLAAEESGMFSHITSLKPVNPANQPNAWEQSALRALEQGQTEVTGLETRDGRPYMLLVRPLYIEQVCLRCHGFQGYKLGDVRGAISVSVPIEPIRQAATKELVTALAAYGALWLLGAMGIAAGGWRVVRHVAAREEALFALAQSEQRFRRLFQQCNDAVIMRRPDGRILDLNDRACEMFGYRRAELIGNAITAIYPASSPTDSRPDSGATGGGAATLPADCQAVCKNGTVLDVEISSTAVEDDHGVVQDIVRDVTSRRQADKRLAAYAREQGLLNALLRIEAEDLPLDELLQRCLDEIVATAWLWPQACGAVFLVEDGAETLRLCVQRNLWPQLVRLCDRVPFGRCLCGRAAVTGEILYAACMDDRHETRFAGMEPHGHYVVPLRSGDKVLGVMVLYLPEGHSRDEREEEFLHVVGSTLAGHIEKNRSEADLRKKDEQLRQSQKLEVVGQLAGGIAHEFNNLLQAISGYTEFALRSLSPEQPCRQDLQEVMKAADRAATLTRQLLGFSRRQPLERRNIDPTQVVADLAKMVRRVIGEHITVKTILGEKVGIVYADPVELQQALLNLCLNARDAMPSGGELLLKTEKVFHRDGYWEADVRADAGWYVMISVTDTGCGMTPEVKARIFEPFFTTKEVGKGTGLGLAKVHGVIRQHGGTIRVYSEPGQGTTFRLYLPLADANPEPDPVEVQSTDCHGSETILVAEDEPMVRNLASRILQGAGYTVLTASDGKAALRVFQENRQRIDLAMLDVVMPYMSGSEVLTHIRSEDPDFKVVFCSGYDPESAHCGSVRQDHACLIQKPFSPDALLRTVREVLDRDALCPLTGGIA